MNKQLHSGSRHLIRSPLATIVSSLVGLYGLYIIVTTLLDQFQKYRLKLLNSFIIDTHLLLGLGLIYLSILLFRRKRNAFYVALVASIVLLIEGINELVNHLHLRGLGLIILVRYIIMPLAVLATK